jgi:phosphonate transport system substrate-binding protein
MTNPVHAFLRATLLVLTAFILLAQPATAAEKPLILGVFPYLSGYSVVNKFTPLRDYLAAELKRPVQVYTAPDFNTFIERTRRGDYDIALTAPHLARLAILDDGYVPLATYKATLQTMVVVKKDAPYTTLADLRGESIAIPDKLAIVTLLGTQLLRKENLRPGQDYTLVATQSHSSAALSVQYGQQDAAIVGSNPFNQLAPETLDRLRILASSSPLPTQYYIAHKRLGSRQIARLQSLLVTFAETPSGQIFIGENRFLGIKTSSGDELKQLDDSVNEVKRLLEKPGQSNAPRPN